MAALTGSYSPPGYPITRKAPVPFLILLLAFLIRLGLLVLAAWLLTLAVPNVLADPDHFTGWLGVLVAAGIALTPTSTSISGK